MEIPEIIIKEEEIIKRRWFKRIVEKEYIVKCNHNYHNNKFFKTKENAESYKQKLIEYFNAPEFIIEKNLNNQYRIKYKTHINSYISQNLYDVMNDKLFNSLEEAEEYLKSIKNKNKWKKIKEVY